MAKPPRLKVYAATLGFYETVVAAANQTAALAAWGVHRNLFAEGAATVAEDPTVVEAAVAQPGVVLRRAIGSADAFTADAPARMDVPQSTGRPKTKAARAAPPPPPKPKPDRTALSAAEAALRMLEAERRTVDADLDRRRAALEAEAVAIERDLRTRQRVLTRDLDRALAAWRKAGGTD